MKPNASQSWRLQGDAVAFDYGSWEFRATQFYLSVDWIDNQRDADDLDSMMLLFSTDYLISLSIELITKAFYLKKGYGPKEDIYTHDVLDLELKDLFDDQQRELVRKCQRCVVWSGRYPTPKWTKEKFKEDYDVPSIVKDGMEHIDGSDIPGSINPDEVRRKKELYLHIWRKLKEE